MRQAKQRGASEERKVPAPPKVVKPNARQRRDAVLDWIALALLAVEALCFFANLVISFRQTH